MSARQRPIDPQGLTPATADAPAFIRATDSIPKNINWAVKSAFASVLFEPPSADRTPTAEADTTVIERVTAATCLVRAMPYPLIGRLRTHERRLVDR